MGKHQLKEIFTEKWDPTQLKFVAAASNKEFYDLMKENGIEKQQIQIKYKSKYAKWFKKNLKYRAFGQSCPESKPVNYTSNDTYSSSSGSYVDKSIQNLKDMFKGI